MSKQTDWLASTRQTVARVADEAQAGYMAAEDALARLEDREARRATRAGGGR